MMAQTWLFSLGEGGYFTPDNGIYPHDLVSAFLTANLNLGRNYLILV